MPAKRTFADRFYGLLERALRDIDQKAIEADVKALRKLKPGASRRELAMYMTNRAARKTAAVGAAASTATGVISLVALAPDIFNLVRQQSRLVLSIAYVYDHKPTLRERTREVLLTLGTATGASVTKKGAQYLVMRKLGESSVKRLARQIAPRLIGRKLAAAAAPAVGFILGGVMNYLSVRAVGIAAQKYYSALARQRQTTSAARSSRPSSRKKRARARSRPAAGPRAQR